MGGEAKGEILTGATDANTGTGTLLLETAADCQNVRAEQTIRAPEPEGADGPAVRFWYRSTGLANANFATEIPRSRVTRPSRSEWTEQVTCVPPARATRPMKVSFLLLAGGSCGSTFSAERVFIDDVEATTHPDCPPE